MNLINYFKEYKGIASFWDIIKLWWWDTSIYHTYRHYYYKIMDPLWYRHNVIKIETLPPSWTDRDCALLHAIFQILVDFWEKEVVPQEKYINEGREEINDHELEEWEIEVTKEHDKRRNAIHALYYWWKNSYPAMEHWNDDMYANGEYSFKLLFGIIAWSRDEELKAKCNAAFDKYRDEREYLATQYFYEFENEMAKRVIDLRASFWT